jgi:AcrR family transcriptional regulator
VAEARGTRERLIEVAAELVDEGGPAAVTLREVGARAGVSHNTPYRHFADKRDLLAVVAAGALHDLAARFRAACAAGGDGAERVERAALSYLGWAADHPARFKLVFGAWGAEPHDELGAAAGSATEAMHACVASAIEDGSLAGEPERVAAMVWALGHGAVDLALSGHLAKRPTSPTAEELVHELVTRLRGARS